MASFLSSITLAIGRHCLNLAKLLTQQKKSLAALFSALETSFFAALSAWNLKKWINSKKLQPSKFRIDLNGLVGMLPSAPAGTAPKHPTKQFQQILEFGYMHRNSVISSVLAPATKSRTRVSDALTKSPWIGRTGRPERDPLVLSRLIR